MKAGLAGKCMSEKCQSPNCKLRLRFQEPLNLTLNRIVVKPHPIVRAARPVMALG